jgi:hypothetical protein
MRCREERRLEEGRQNSRMGRQRQLETPVRKSTHKCGNNLRKHENKKRGLLGQKRK